MGEYFNIVCLLNILSPWRAKADGFFDFVREPIRQGCGIDIGYAPGRQPSKLHPAFDLAHFRKLVKNHYQVETNDLWLASYHCMPEIALDYIFHHLPENPLILTSEIPPWLRKACIERQQPFLDIRQSPLGFGRDSLIALDTNDLTLRTRLAKHSISEEELRLEAGLLSANMRIHRAQLEENLRHVFNLDGALIHIWQPPWDINLLQPDGHIIQFSDFSSQLREMAKGRNALLMCDFSDTHMADTFERERSALSTILNQPVRFCPQNIYQILSGHDDCELVSINTGAHQEAPYFNKKSRAFAPPATPLATDLQQSGYLQVHFHEILAPSFWHQVLSPEKAAPRISHLPVLDRQLARENMNDWGEYEKVLTWERYLPRQAYRRLGGTVAHQRIEDLEKRLLSLPQASRPIEPSSLAVDSMRSRIQALKDTKIGETAYVLGNGPSLNELNIEKLMSLDSFWCNKAYKMEQNGTKFQPKYYFLYDPIIIHQDSESVLNIQAELKFFAQESFNLAKIIAPEKTKNIISFTPIHHPPMFADESNFSTDPASGLFHGGSILTFAIQFAFYMGYSRVLVGGADLDYSQPYFYGSLHKHKSTNISVNAEKMKKSFHVLRKNFEKNGRLLAKITKSPNLSLEYMEIPEIKKQKF